MFLFVFFILKGFPYDHVLQRLWENKVLSVFSELSPFPSDYKIQEISVEHLKADE